MYRWVVKAAGSLLLVLVFFFSLAMPALAEPLGPWAPFFSVQGGDTLVGGWFNNVHTCNTDTPDSVQAGPYQAPTGPNSKYRGGILSYGVVENNGTQAAGGKSDRAVFSLGAIDGWTDGQWDVNSGSAGPPPTGRFDLTKQYGFISGANAGQPGSKKVSFANGNQETFANFDSGPPPKNYSGGMFEDNLGDSNYINGQHCIPDYYDTKLDLPQQPPTMNNHPTYVYVDQIKKSGQYAVGNGDDTIYVLLDSGGTNDATLDSNASNISLFVNGNVFIASSIHAHSKTYNSLQKFALVVKGNIYVGSDVNQLDGFYVAQPRDDGSHGIFYSCHDLSNNMPTTTFINHKCSGSTLNISGALYAADVEFLRWGGNLTQDASNNSGPAESVTYTPDMVLGGGFFHGPSNGSSLYQARVQSIVSLPPVY